MPVRFTELTSFDQINLGATFVLAAVVVAFAIAVIGVWLTHRRPAMRALAAYWALFGCAALVNVGSSWSGAVWRDRVLSLTLTGVLVALHAAAVPFARASVLRLANAYEVPGSAARAAWLVGLVVLTAHVLGVFALLARWPDVRLAPILWSRGIHVLVYLWPAVAAFVYRRRATRNRVSILLLICGFSALAGRGVLELALGLRVGMPDLPAWARAAAILFNLFGMMALGVASLIAMAAEEEEVVRRQGEELRRAEWSRQQGSRLESLGRLASGVAHDFNNVLAVVFAAAQNLRDDAPTASQLEEIAGLESAADRGRGLVKQLLTFARQQPAGNDTFDVETQLDAMRGMLERLSGRATFHLSLEGAATLVRMDRSQFDQVVLNLVVNARDANGTGGRIALSSCRRHTPPSGVLAARATSSLGSASPAVAPAMWACITVEDTGPGIPGDVLPYIFEPFFSTKSPEHGTGLGLATVLGVVAGAGGDIVVDTVQGRGTRIEVWLPTAASPFPSLS